MPRTLFIGDIQGCYDEFIELLEKLQYNPENDQLFLVGDTINRGPKSHLMLQHLLEHPEIKSVKGNHEHYFIEYVEKNLDNSSSFKRIKEQCGDHLEEYIHMIKAWPYFIEEPNWLLVHAGLLPERKPENTHVRELCSVREVKHREIKAPWFKFYKCSKPIIYGHWAQKGLTIRKNTKGLDSGCVYGKELSAYILEENMVISVKAHRVWYDPVKKIELW